MVPHRSEGDMQFDIPISAYVRSRWTVRLALAALFLGAAIETRGHGSKC